MCRVFFAAMLAVVAACGGEPAPVEDNPIPPPDVTAAPLPDPRPARAETLTGERPLIIAHRGASGELPEHTLPAYERAIDQGADFIEPDLVMTKDGVLIARHDRYLSTTTDVADRPEFADRKRVVETPDGAREDWWAEDFTLAEIKTLRARQPFDGRSKEFDGLYEVPTFDEVLALAVSRGVGVYPETKSPAYHASIGLDMKPPLVAALRRADFVAARVPVFIQSFEPAILRALDAEGDWPLVQLVSGDPQMIAAGLAPPLKAIAEYADGVGANKLFLGTPETGRTDFVGRAHELGLFVHAWTYRDDAVGPGFDAPEEEIRAAFDRGVDGVFTDFPATAAAVR